MEQQQWRIWNPTPPPSDELLKNLLNNLNAILRQRTIREMQGPNILRWGKLTGGSFNLKEACSYLENGDDQEKVAWYDNVWAGNLWPKIKTFLWLLQNRKVLTWENLTKRGFIGPSHCPMCEQQEETINHLFNDCVWTSNLWDWLQGIFHLSDRQRNSIYETITS